MCDVCVTVGGYTVVVLAVVLIIVMSLFGCIGVIRGVADVVDVTVVNINVVFTLVLVGVAGITVDAMVSYICYVSDEIVAVISNCYDGRMIVGGVVGYVTVMYVTVCGVSGYIGGSVYLHWCCLC